ncbi:hypothetical protein [Nioella sp.]|uniref:hypothetical protein n=1 Tax=Nioella sp. TaxID=1912091 RepID=UPI003B527FF2
MSSPKRNSIESEINQISEMLEIIPREANIERYGLEQRLETLRKKLDDLPLECVRPTSKLLFRGEQVDGSHGIRATFGGKVAKSFSDAYSAVVAGVKENLRYMGPIPARSDHELLIVGTAAGSFGFQLELPELEPDLLFEGETLEEGALKDILKLMETSATGSDDEIAEIVEKVHPRAVRKVSDFLNLVASSNTVVSLEVGTDFFRYPDVDTLSSSAVRLREENIREYDEEHTGAFIGVLPKSRNFEFETASKDVFRGRLSPEIENPNQIVELLQRLVRAKFSVMQVGQGRPRYLLESLDDISDINSYEG